MLLLVSARGTHYHQHFLTFFNDLFVYIKSLHLGVNIGDSLCISILLYADDIILLALTEGDLQIMLNGLNDWCNNWKLRVNLKKIKYNSFQEEENAKNSI